MKPKMADKNYNLHHTIGSRRDAYGFVLRPQHIQRYREYTSIYKEEEEERSEKWNIFLEHQLESNNCCVSEEESREISQAETSGLGEEIVSEKGIEGNDHSEKKSDFDGSTVSESTKELQFSEKPEKEELSSEERANEAQHSKESNKDNQIPKESEQVVQNLEVSEKVQLSKENKKEELLPKPTKDGKVQRWSRIRISLRAIENMMSSRVKIIKNMKGDQNTASRDQVLSTKEADLEGDVCVKDNSVEKINTSAENSPELFFPWKQELEFLVHGGIPKELRGEVWQAFIGVKSRRVERYYEKLLADADESNNLFNLSSVPEKWKRQIEKDIPRTFPGHPALDEHGRDSLRRLLLAYARHNPSVGYCQAMNFFAGLLLLLMPEENAFWALVGIIDDFFNGYFTEEMIESQVDQLVFEELMRERFPKLVNHLDYLGVQVAWITSPWFLSIFVNMIPWESVLRVWDVILYEGNRVMMFRTGLALMELYGPALLTSQDAGDAITLLQSLTGSTFDSSQLVFTACMGFLAVNEARLQEMRKKHRPAVLQLIDERSKGITWKNSTGVASKLYSFKRDSGEAKKTGEGDKLKSEHLSTNMDGPTAKTEEESLRDLQEQVVWLKVELCRLLEEKRSAILRSEELETAFMEMVQEDNRMQLSAKIEQLEQEVANLKQALADKKEQEAAMLEILMRVEQEQRITEEARRIAEQDAAAQRYAVTVLQEKYEMTMASMTQMEQRMVMAESMLEATINYESGQAKAHSSPRAEHNQSSSASEGLKRRIGLLKFGLGWRDRNKGKTDEVEGVSSSNEGKDPNT